MSSFLVVAVGCEADATSYENGTEEAPSMTSFRSGGQLQWIDVTDAVSGESSRAPWASESTFNASSSKMEEEGTVALLAAATGTTLPLRKCCPRGQGLNVERTSCETLPSEGSLAGRFPSRDTFSVEGADGAEVVMLGSSSTAMPCPKNSARVLQPARRVVLRALPPPQGGGDGVNADVEETCVDVSSSENHLIVARCLSRDVACDGDASAPGEPSGQPGQRTCVSKCCPLGFSYVGKTCARTDHQLPLQFKRSFVEVQAPDSLAFIEGRPACSKVHPLEPSKREDDKWHLQQNGRILRPAMSRLYTHDGYCLEHLTFTGMEPGVRAFVCFPSHDRLKQLHEIGLPFPLRAAGLLLSVAALALTLLAYCLLPPLRNLYGKTVMAASASQLCAFLCLATAQLLSRQLSTAECKAIGYSIFFWFLSNFAWLNVLSFDIWWTFGALRGRYESGGRARNRRRFLLYSLYAWGLPAALSALTVSVNEFGETWGVYHDFRPNIAVWDCFLLRGSMSRVLYLQIPLALMAGVNVVLFVLTARRCWRVKAEIARLTGGRQTDSYCSTTSSLSLNSKSINSIKSNNSGCKKKKSDTVTSTTPAPQRKMTKFRADCERFLMNVKLLVAMGVPWVLDIVSDFFIEPQWVWYVTDMLLSLQGVYIFCIYVLKSKVLSRLRRRVSAFPCFRCCFAASTSGGAAVDSSPAANRGTQRSLVATAAITSGIRLPAVTSSNGKDQIHKTASSSTLCTVTTSVGGTAEPRHSPSPKQIAAHGNR